MIVTTDKDVLILNGHRIQLAQSIVETVVAGDIVVVELNVDEFEVDDALVARNVIAFDSGGNEIWRIAPTGRTRPRPDGSQAPEAYFGLGFAEDGKTVQIGTPDGFDYDIDVATGELSNPVFTK